MIEKLLTLENSNRAYDCQSARPEIDLNKPLPDDVTVERG